MEPRLSIITLGVQDMEKSFRFYGEGLGFPSKMTPEEGIVFFQTGGVRLALYPLEKLAEDVSPDYPKTRSKFTGITLAHNTRKKEEVDEILKKATEAGGKLEKEAQPTFWGGYSGYFSDPDGYLWEVAWAESFEFNDDGSLVV